MTTTINPATEQKMREYHFLDPDETNRCIDKTWKAFTRWKQQKIEERSGRMRKAAKILRAEKDTFARLMAEEMGKPLSDGQAEAEKCAWACDYYADNTAQFLAAEMAPSDASKSFITFQPLGIVFAIMPWNFPFWQVFRFAAPSMMAGNAVLLKHAPNVFGCAEAIEAIFSEAGFPKYLFQNLIIDTDMAAKVIEHPMVKAVTLTGSTRAGKAVAEKAGSCLKKTVMELGGSDPYIILEDADLELAVETCVTSRLINNGQSCISAKRFIVHQSIGLQFEEKLVNRMKAAKVGDPLDPGTQLGPLARADLRDNLHRQVQASINLGATCLLGGTVPEGIGYFYPPTVLTNVKKGMPAFDEELFGPVAAIISVEDEEEAIKVANDSVYGLGAALFSADLAKAEKIATEQLEAGSCFINSFVKSDPRLPFGGIKESGYGRELGHYGIKEFVNIKTVFVK